MTILLYIPPANIRRCFSPEDLNRLNSFGCPLLIMEEDTPAAMREWLAKHSHLARIIITGWGTPPITADELDAAPALEAVIHAAGTVKNVFPEKIWDAAIRVASCNKALAVGVAETTLGMIISGVKGFFYSREWTRRGGWSDSHFGRPYPSVREMFGLKIGIVSASQVGRHLLRLLQAFEVELFIYDPYLKNEDAAALGASLVSLSDLFTQCDVITIHSPALPATHHLISAELLSNLKDNALLINTARGSIIDQNALRQALESGRFTAILDVTDPEPPAADEILRILPNVILTSHLSGAVTNGCLRQGRSAVSQVGEFLKGQAMHGEIHREMLVTMA